MIYNFPIGFCLCLFNISGRLVWCSVSTVSTDPWHATLRACTSRLKHYVVVCEWIGIEITSTACDSFIVGCAVAVLQLLFAEMLISWDWLVLSQYFGRILGLRVWCRFRSQDQNFGLSLGCMASVSLNNSSAVLRHCWSQITQCRNLGPAFWGLSKKS